METPGGLWRRPGGAVLNPRPLNLLRYPRRAGMLDPTLWRPGLCALLAGGVVAAAWVASQLQRQDQLLAERGPLQARLQEQARQQAQALQAEALAHAQARMQKRAQTWQVQREQLMRLHAELSAQAEHSGLRLQRWQGDGRKLTLQLWLPRPELAPALVSRLSQASPQAWALQSLAERPDAAGVEAVLEASWPAPAHPPASGGRKP